MAANIVMNNPELRNLILSMRNESMFIDEQNKTKMKMALCLNDIKKQVVSDNHRSTWCRIDSDGEYYFICYCYKNGIPVIWYRNMFNPWILMKYDL